MRKIVGKEMPSGIERFEATKKFFGFNGVQNYQRVGAGTMSVSNSTTNQEIVGRKLVVGGDDLLVFNKIKEKEFTQKQAEESKKFQARIFNGSVLDIEILDQEVIIATKNLDFSHLNLILDGPENLRQGISLQSVDLMTRFFSDHKHAKEARQSSELGPGASVAAINYMLLVFLEQNRKDRNKKDGWLLEAFKVASKASQDAKEQLVKHCIDYGSFEQTIEAAKIRGLNDGQLNQIEIDSLVHSLEKRNNYNEAESALYLGASIRCCSQFAGLLIDRKQPDIAAKIANELGVVEEIRNRLCKLYMSMNDLEKALCIARLGVSILVCTELIKKSAEKGWKTVCAELADLRQKPLTEFELKILASANVSRRAWRNTEPSVPEQANV